MAVADIAQRSVSERLLLRQAGVVLVGMSALRADGEYDHRSPVPVLLEICETKNTPVRGVWQILQLIPLPMYLVGE